MNATLTNFTVFGEAQIANLTKNSIQTLRMTNVTVNWTSEDVAGITGGDLTPMLVADWLRNKLNDDFLPFFDVWIQPSP